MDVCRDATEDESKVPRILHLVAAVTDEVYSFLGPALRELSYMGRPQSIVLLDDEKARKHIHHLQRHAEVVLVAWKPEDLSLDEVLRTFWEGHDPTQGMRQGNDVGTQYRSAIYTTTPEQLETAERVRDEYQVQFTRSGYGRITTEIKTAPDFYYAEDYHQQYLDKNPFGYCPVHATGVTCN